MKSGTGPTLPASSARWGTTVWGGRHRREGPDHGLQVHHRQRRGATSDAIQGLDYARAMGAQVINCSWAERPIQPPCAPPSSGCGTPGFWRYGGVGNHRRGHGTQPRYPASYAFENMLTVVATTASDGLADFSNYGATVARPGAPGEGIFSTRGSPRTTPTRARPARRWRLRWWRRADADAGAFLPRRPCSWWSASCGDGSPAGPGGPVRVRGPREPGARAARHPLRGFRRLRRQGAPPLGVQFTNTTRGTFEGASWDFGDGTTSTADSPAHVFGSEGSFPVTLTVVGPTRDLEDADGVRAGQLPGSSRGPSTGWIRRR